MRVAFFSAHRFDRVSFDAAAGRRGHEIVYLDAGLEERTAELAEGFGAVCAFVNDRLSGPVLERLAGLGVGLVALRSAGFNNVDVPAAERLGLTVARVPAYSPHAVAEHTVGLMMTLNRKFHRAYNRVREHNFGLDGLLGFDFHGKTAGVVGTGRIGAVVVRILRGLGCEVLAHDAKPSVACLELGARYVEMGELLERSDIVTLHCPLTPETRHLINADAIRRMKRGVMLINTSRGAVVETRAVIDGLKRGHIGSVGLDVYEEEADLFFHDLSEEIIQDEVFARLLTFPNVVITAHQAFFTREALAAIAETTLGNISDYEAGRIRPENLVTRDLVAPGRP